MDDATRSSYQSKWTPRPATSFPVLIILAGLLIPFFYLGPDGPGVVMVPLLLFGALFLLQHGLRLGEIGRAVQRLVDGRAPRQGRLCAIGGTAVALDPGHGRWGDSLLAFHAQTFDRLQRRRGRPGMVPAELRYEAYYLAPTGIKTANGTVPVQGFPDLHELEKTDLPQEVIAQAKAGALQTEARRADSKPPTRVFSSITDRAEMYFQYDVDPNLGVVQTGATSIRSGGEGYTRGWAIGSGDDICVIGKWQDGKLVRSPKHPSGLPVFSGSAEEIRREQGDTGKGLLILAAVLFAIAAGLAVWSLM